MEQAVAQAIPWQAILSNPGSAWAVVFVILLIFVMWQNGKREERMQNTLDTTIKDHSQTIARQTETLNNVNTSLISIKDALSDVKNRVEDIEDAIGLKKEMIK